MIAWPAHASGIKQVYSWELHAAELFAFCTSTRKGELLVYTDGPAAFTGTLFKRDKEKGGVRIDHGIVLPGSLDTNFFGVRGVMKQIVYAVQTATGVTYQLYNVKPGPVTTPIGAFTIPTLVSFGVTWFSKGAGSLDAVAVNGSAVTLRVRTYDRAFAPVLDQQVEAYLPSRARRAPANGIIMNSIAVFQEDGKYLRVLNGTDPVSGVPRFNFYKVSRTKLTPVAAPSLVSQLLGEDIGPFVYPVYTNGFFYVYDKTKRQTIAGPFAVPDAQSNELFGASWVFAKPVNKPLLATLIPELGDITPTAELITMGVTAADGYTLRSYRVTTSSAKALQRSAAITGVSSCELYGRSFLVVATNGAGSTVHKIASRSLKQQAAQACTSAAPIISSDRFFIDDATAGIHRTVTVWTF